MTNQKRIIAVFLLITVLLLAEIIWWFIFNERIQSDYRSTYFELLEQRSAAHNGMSDSVSTSGISQLSDGRWVIDSATVNEFVDQQNRWTTMFISESIFFFILIFVGVWIVYRSLRRDVDYHTRKHHFFISASHELKTPLAAIRLNLQTLQKKQGTDSFISAALDQVHRLNGLISQILNSIYTDPKRIDSSQVDTISLIQSVQSELQPATSKKIDIEGPDSLLLAVNPDEFKLIWSNLISNSIKHNQNIDISIRILIRLVGRKVVFHFQDTGRGIPADVLKRVFDPEFGEIQSERGNFESGLGLHLVALLTEKNGGQIRAQESDRGADIRLEFTR